MALKKIFTVEQWREIESEAKYRTVSLDKKAPSKTEEDLNKDMKMFELQDNLSRGPACDDASSNLLKDGTSLTYRRAD